MLDFYNKLSAQEKKIFFVALAVVTLVLFDFLFFQPVSSKMKNIETEIDQIQSDIKRDVRYLAYQEKILKEDELYHSFKPDVMKTDEEVTAAFLKTIENLATDSEVTLGKLNPAESTPKKGYIQYSASVDCTGKLENIIKFIHKVNITNNLLKVVKMNMTGKKASADEVVVSLKITKMILDAKAVGNPETGNDLTLLKHAKEILNGTIEASAIPLNSEGGEGEAAATGEGTSGAGEAGTSTNIAVNGEILAGPHGEGGSGPESLGGATGSSSRPTSSAVAGSTPHPEGSTSEASGSEKSIKSDKSSKDKEEKSPKKVAVLQKVSNGPRLTAKKGLEEWWADFWGGGKAEEERKKKAAIEAEEEKEVKPNLIQKILNKGSPADEEIQVE